MKIPELDFAQSLGLLSFALGLLCFYQKNDSHLKVLMVFMYVSHAFHFMLLGATIAALTAVLAIVRTLASLKTSSAVVAYVFIGVSCCIGLVLSNSWLDFLPVIGGCVGTYALFCMRGINMRVAFAIGGLCWLANNILIGSIGTSLLEITILGVNLGTIYRLYKDETHEDKVKQQP